jgi:3' terminal RNA ribose 2'-O-methyltransferase Hen1
VLVLLTLTTTHRPATDLGFLLRKNPANVRTVELPFGTARVFYPEAEDERCTAALTVDVDPVGLVRTRKTTPGESASLRQYVNDRPYVASSFLSVAIAKLYGSAMAGTPGDRPELADAALPLVAWLPVVPARGGADLVERLFAPLGYRVETSPIVLDPATPDWGDSRYVDLRLSADVRLADLLAHLYVLLPVLDDDKHYWVGDDEVDKLLRRGGDWLAGHPERDLITRRYLRHHRHLTTDALARLLDDTDGEAAGDDPVEEAVEAPVRLNDLRVAAVTEALLDAGAHRVLDLGCGDGKLLMALVAASQFSEIVGVDVSTRALATAHRRLHLDQVPEHQKGRVQLRQSALTYRDRRNAGYDAAAVAEVVEHLDPERLEAFEQALFGAARPGTVVVTTPNVEHNVRYETLPTGQFRHHDHRFEWSRAEFQAWAVGVAERNGYAVTHAGIGPEDPEVGPPTQMAVFRR